MKIISIANTLSLEASSKGLVNVILENGEKRLLKDMPLPVIEDFKIRLEAGFSSKEK